MHLRHRLRNDELVAEMRDEFAIAERNMLRMYPGERYADFNCEEVFASYCIVDRHAFGESSVAGRDSSDILGVFATRDIAENTMIVFDQTETWGCIGPGVDGSTSNLHGATGCSDPIHPNLPSEDVSKDLRWIRQRVGRDAAEVILRCRFLICCVRDEQLSQSGPNGINAHPLDHSLIARLTPIYREKKVHLFSLERDIAIPNDLLILHGIDIFAAKEYDTWVLFTLRAKVENNSWTIHSIAVFLPFSLSSTIVANQTWTG